MRDTTPAIRHDSQSRSRGDEGRDEGEGANAVRVGQRKLDGSRGTQARADDVGGSVVARDCVCCCLRDGVFLRLGGVGESDAARIDADRAEALAQHPGLKREGRDVRSEPGQQNDGIALASFEDLE